ncbi:type II toxin-antitoxin system HicB family antitoxin [Desulfofundulus thermocisternus]|uniref:type II toxin-antitoxin system HicB family antitoxin n=1 Tax=Desulfofundulus thermocisternus TaxID=42471 RepID=UPI000A4F30E3|nr:type II toxin-antitoxin system HicB family antitoxin [Desulfofundulus thermocisternus]
MIVTCPVFEGCYSQGDTFEEAMHNIREAIELCLEEKAEKMPVKTIIVGNVVVG